MPSVSVTNYDDSDYTEGCGKQRCHGNPYHNSTPPCGAPTCLASQLKEELRFLRQIEDKHYSNLVNLIIGTSLTTMAVIVTAIVSVLGKH